MNERDLQSLGYAAAMYQRDPREIACGLKASRALAALKAGQPAVDELQPALTLNGLAYFPADHIAAAVAWLAKRDAKRAKAEAASHA